MQKTISFVLFVVLAFTSMAGTAFSEERLIIVNLWPDERSAAAEEKLKKSHPNIVVEYQQVEDRQVLTTRFLSMDTDMDVVCFSEWDGVKGLFAAMEGALENLSLYPPLVACREEQFDLWKNYTIGDYWFGVPCIPHESLVYLNTSLFSEMGIPLPDLHWTWDDFWRLAHQVEQYNSENQTHFALFKDSSKNCVATQYAANTVDYVASSHAFGEDAFSLFITQWKNLFDKGLVWDPMSNRNQGGAWNESETLMMLSEVNFGNAGILGGKASDIPWKEFDVRLLPQSDQLQPSLISGYILSIPVASKQKETAALWLEYYMDADISSDGDALLNLGPMYKDDAHLSAVQNGKSEKAIEKMNLWTYGLEHAKLNAYNELTHAVSVRYWWQLRDGEITVEDYIAACTRFANQYLDE